MAAQWSTTMTARHLRQWKCCYLQVCNHSLSCFEALQTILLQIFAEPAVVTLIPLVCIAFKNGCLERMDCLTSVQTVILLFPLSYSHAIGSCCTHTYESSQRNARRYHWVFAKEFDHLRQESTQFRTCTCTNILPKQFATLVHQPKPSVLRPSARSRTSEPIIIDVSSFSRWGVFIRYRHSCCGNRAHWWSIPSYQLVPWCE
jgi:hypothetical protein